MGLRVICLFLSDIEKIGGIIRENFEVITEDNKIDDSKFASFGYMSVHFIVKLGDAYKKTAYADTKDLPFEIQVRTIAMDVRANVSHYLDYKTDQDIPDDLKKDFYALSAMFYVADKHFQLFFEQRVEKQEEISNVFEKGRKEDILSQPINLDTMTAFLRDKFPDREHVDSSSVSVLIDELTEAGYESIREIDEMVDNGMDAFKAIENDNGYTPDNISDFGVVNLIAMLTNDNFLNIVFWDDKEQAQFFLEDCGKYRELLRKSK